MNKSNRQNKIVMNFPSLSQNETLARNVCACVAVGLSPTVADVSDIKTAVSEAVTNSIVHGYPDSVGNITLEIEIMGNEIHINVLDSGIGIEEIEEAMTPTFTTKPEGERSGMGFTIMQSFMDEVKVVSQKGKGTAVYMVKRIKSTDEGNDADTRPAS